jgi:hypothetical protein
MITLKRFAYHPEGTLGLMQVPNHKLSLFYTVERPWLDNAPFLSCIPEGEYSMVWKRSPKFDWCYEVENVKGRSHILFHVANFPEEIEGCIGVGTSLMGDRIAVAESRKGIEAFHEATGGNQWRLKIVNAPLAALKSL